jgi:hypothetical protein
LSVGGDVTVAGVLTYEDVTNVDSIGIVTARSGVDVTGNISVSGTVDGRDVATDGTKLDGIAAGAEVNVQSDWNASSGDAHILNKPTIPTNTNQLTNGAGFITAAALASSFTKYTYASGSSHTWTKPSTGSTVIVLAWGGGGGGGSYDDNSGGGGGGGGGSCSLQFLKMSDLGSTETITIGQGGTGSNGGIYGGTGTNGGNTTFGSHVTAYGGHGGYGNNNTQRYVTSSTPIGMGGLSGGGSNSEMGESMLAGGRGAGNRNSGGNHVGPSEGGDTIYGGGGGGHRTYNSGTSGGTSAFAGNGGAGGNTGSNGSTPGGGGGGSRYQAGSGGDGECWVLIF